MCESESHRCIKGECASLFLVMAVVPRTEPQVTPPLKIHLQAFFLMFFFKTRSKVCPGWPKIYPVTPVRLDLKILFYSWSD